MKSPPRGKRTSPVEVLNLSPRGMWLLVKEREFFLPIEEHPWFKDATVAELSEVELLHGAHLHWPALDVDLAVDSLERPEAYPLASRVRVRKHAANQG